ncbi:MAG: tetratricopeptide repeat protein [Methanobacteriota archaeon]|nr:MAG: tetratricopeptide repeat protein [Euryarchaeota archaeon]
MTEVTDERTSGRGPKIGDLFTRANKAYDSGDYEAALRLLSDALAIDPENVVALNNKGAALDALGKHDLAESCYRRALALDDGYELAWHNLGNCLFAQEEYGGAAKAYARASALNPERAENFIGIAESHAELGETRRASAAIAKIPPKEDDSHLLTQADLYLSVQLGDKAMRCCEQYVSCHPDDVAGHVHLGGVLQEIGRYKDAIPSFERALKLSPDDAQIWNNFGYTCFCAGKTERALAAFDKSIEIDPSYKHAWYNKGYALHGVDRLEEAVECYREALKIDDKDRVLLNNHGNALYNLGRYAESIPSFVAAITADPNYEIAWNNIGNALEKMGIHAEAIPFHDRSLEIRPDFDYALYAKGVCKAAIGDVEEGYDLLLESLDINPSYDEAWKAKSSVARQLGRMDDAISSIDRALTINPELCEAWIDRGDLLVAVGDGVGAEQSYARALKCVAKAIAASPSDGEPWRIRAETLVRVGRHADALDAAVRAVTSPHSDITVLPLAFDVCRLSGVDGPPQELLKAVKACAAPAPLLAYARYLGARERWGDVVDILYSRDMEELTPASRLLFVKALTLLGDPEAADSVAADSPKPERARLRAEIEMNAAGKEFAADRLEEILSKWPSDHAAAMCVAKGFMEKRAFRDAIVAAETAIGSDEADWEPYEIIADAYEALGMTDKSDEAKRRAGQLLARCADQVCGAGRDDA